MKNIALWGFCLLIAFSCSDREVDVVSDNGTLIINVNVVSPEQEEILKDAFIFIENDTVAYLGTEKPKIKGVYQKIDAGNAYIIPGLIDSHVHITTTNGLSEQEELENAELVKEFREQLPKSYLYYGYTTIIDLGAFNPSRLKDFMEAEIRPDLFYVGGGAVIGNGYGMTNWKDEQPNFIYLESDAENIPEQYSKENHTPKAVVQRIAESGAIAVKSYYEPGLDRSHPRLPVPTEELFQELLQETHDNDLVLAVHGNSLEAHDFIGKNKADIVAHGLWNWGEFRIDEEGNIPPQVKKVLDQEISNNVGYTATLQVIRGLKALAESNYLDDPQLAEILPQSILDYYQENKEGMYANVFGSAPKEIIDRNFSNISRQGQAALKYLSDNGGQVLFGTDTPAAPTYGNPPGYNAYLEMKGMHEAGLSLKEILTSATINNAKAFSLEDQYGSIQVGKKANLVLLEKNPLEDIEAYNSIRTVFISGKNMNREAFSANR